MRRVFAVSKINWTEWLGTFLTFVALTVTTVLTVSSIDAGAASGMINDTNVVQELPMVKLVDQSARTKYLATQAEKATEQTEQVRIVYPAARTTVTTPVKKPIATTPSCDRLIIEKIGLNACLATVGLTAGGAVDVHASLPAWFNQSSRAGTRNGKYPVTFIDGHRSGIFRNLGQLAVNDEITVAFMNGESYTYRVQFKESMSLSQATEMMAKALRIYGGAAQGLNLMTCDGAYNSNLGTAESRLMVYATR